MKHKIKIQKSVESDAAEILRLQTEQQFYHTAADANSCAVAC